VTAADPGPEVRPAAVAAREIALVDLLDRLLAGGVVVTGDITLSIADVDLVRISLNAVITSVEAAVPAAAGGRRR
jgi:Gas vesicle protein